MMETINFPVKLGGAPQLFDLPAFDTGYIRFERVSTGPHSPAYNTGRGVS
jgi:hypothetical protein